MHNFDLRLLVPGLLNFIPYLVNQQQANHWLAFITTNFNLNWEIGFFSMVILMLFFITSVTLRLSVTAERFQIRIADNFSFFLVIALLGSVFLPKPVFWFGYIIILSTFPLHDSLSKLLARFLRSISVHMCIVQIVPQNETGTYPPPPPENEDEDVAGDIELGGNIILPEPEPITVAAQPEIIGELNME